MPTTPVRQASGYLSRESGTVEESSRVATWFGPTSELEENLFQNAPPSGQPLPLSITCPEPRADRRCVMCQHSTKRASQATRRCVRALPSPVRPWRRMHLSAQTRPGKVALGGKSRKVRWMADVSVASFGGVPCSTAPGQRSGFQPTSHFPETESHSLAPPTTGPSWILLPTLPTAATTLLSGQMRLRFERAVQLLHQMGCEISYSIYTRNSWARLARLARP